MNIIKLVLDNYVSITYPSFYAKKLWIKDLSFF